MAPEQEPSPEEILLRLIKEGKPSKTPPPSGEHLAAQPQQSAKIDAPAAAGTPRKRAHGLAMRQWSQRVFWEMQWVPRAFLFLCLVMGIVLVFHTVKDQWQMRKNLQQIAAAHSHLASSPTRDNAALAPKVMVATLPPKDLFKPLDESGGAPIAAPAEGRVISTGSILANYALAGIVGGDTPQAIIEDKRQGKSYFLSVGDTLGELHIVAIEEGKVIVSIGNEQAQLDL